MQQCKLGGGGLENYFLRASEDESGLCTTSQSLCTVRVCIAPLSPQERNSHSVSVSINKWKTEQNLTDVRKIYTSISDQLVTLLINAPSKLCFNSQCCWLFVPTHVWKLCKSFYLGKRCEGDALIHDNGADLLVSWMKPWSSVTEKVLSRWYLFTQACCSADIFLPKGWEVSRSATGFKPNFCSLSQVCLCVQIQTCRHIIPQMLVLMQAKGQNNETLDYFSL